MFTVFSVGVVKSENSIESLDKKEQEKPKVVRRKQAPKTSENSSKAAGKPGDPDLTREKLKKTPIVLKKHSHNTRLSVLNKKVEKKLDLISKMPLNIYTRTRAAWKRRQAEPPNGPKAKKPRREDPSWNSFIFFFFIFAHKNSSSVTLLRSRKLNKYLVCMVFEVFFWFGCDLRMTLGWPQRLWPLKKIAEDKITITNIIGPKTLSVFLFTSLSQHNIHD